MIHRQIHLPQTQSYFLFGARQTGKSTLVKTLLKKDAWVINLLLSDSYFSYSKNPSLFRQEAIDKITQERVSQIFIDEIQRIPALLNEIHYLIENYKCQFILTGSSARKLKRGGANLLAGRAVEKHLFPFSCRELDYATSLDELIRFGSLPAIYSKKETDKIDILSTYAHTYLREEIQSEGIVRNLPSFANFLDLAASQNGELVSYSSISRECGLSVKTVQSYYQILEDTLIGLYLRPYEKSARKRLVAHPKFYFFDIGVTNALNKRLGIKPEPMIAGRLFEQLIVLEADRAARSTRNETNLFFWKTNNGAEVDLVLEKHGKILGAFEIKYTHNISGAHLSGLRSFKESHPKVPCYIVSLCENTHALDFVKVLPWKSAIKLICEMVEQ